MIGYPDNIRVSDHGTFLVGITTPRFRKFLPPFLDLIAPYPAFKRFLAKVSALAATSPNVRTFMSVMMSQKEKESEFISVPPNSGSPTTREK